VPTKGRTSAYFWKINGIALMKTAPRAAPPTDPRPPRTIIARYWMETSSPKDSGATLPMDSAYMTPESPAYIELIRNTRPL
jgi:hypothetical protein